MAEVVLDRVSKVYGDGPRAVDSLSLLIADGEFLVLVGPSGCGKTTILRMIAGLEAITEGTISIGSQVVNDTPARDRDLAMVFQSYALYPHLDVEDNIGFGLQLRRTPAQQLTSKVVSAAGTLGLTRFLKRRPSGLSGGQRQRVAMGRAIVRDPKAYLMDEPLSNLDAKRRVQMRAEIARATRETAITTVYVTHDQTEAITLGHRVAVLRKGVLQQVDAPQALYDRPANIFVAGFIGSPAMNLVRGQVDRTADGVALALGRQRIDLDPTVLRKHPDLVDHLGRPIAVGVRPEDLSDAEPAARGWPETVLAGQVDLVEALGPETLVHLRLDAPPLVTAETLELAADAGDDTGIPPAAGGCVLVARFGPRSTARLGEQRAIAVDTERLHFFDLDTGRVIP